MSLTDCWPDWLKRRSSQIYGPNITPYEAYPVYQVQPAIISDANGLTTRANVENSFYQYVAGQIAAANIATRIVHIQPRAVFDCISITAFDDHPPGAGAATNIPIPIFFSWDRPGRIITEAQFASTQEAFLATANAFGSAAAGGLTPSDIPTYVFSATPFSNINGAAYYNAVTIESTRTNRPFYVWFNDSISQPPTGNATFKIQWFTRGR